MRWVKWAIASAVAVVCSTSSAGLAAVPLPGDRSADQAAPSVSAEATPTPAPQRVLPGVVLVPRHHSTRAHHRAEKQADARFFAISSTGSNNVPDVALKAYHHAADVAPAGCGISWTFLAAIGRVESDHGRYGGAQISTDGVSRPVIIGPRLDGSGPFAAVHDTDHGKLDRDRHWDHAVGQMQFLPSTWRMVASDGDGDGVMDPDDINDSALGAARYLCRFGYLGTGAGMARAAFGYNQSDYYVALVLAFEQGYRTGVFVIPSPPAPAGPAHPGLDGKPAKAKAKKAPHHTKPAGHAKPAAQHPVVVPHHPTAPPPKPRPKPTTRPTTPPAPTPTPTPSAPALHALVGTWSACGTDFCVGPTKLDVGDATVQAHQAAFDFDGDGTVETNAGELSGLVGQTVHLQVGDGGLLYVVEGHGFRNADGSFA